MEEEFVGKAGGKRAVRRHHYERLKEKRKGHWGDFDKSPRLLGILARTSAICSCWMCRNERRITGERTMQERKHLQVDIFEDLE